jgi:hypothetical protein
MRHRVTVLALMLLVSSAGCARPPEERALADHVYYLASPTLKGRGPGTPESRQAADYIVGKFKEYGLEPWPGDTELMQPFGKGRNVVGVLRGSDPVLADEMVLLMAHYDHLGECDGDVYPGACDNAAGVAGLLQIARQLSREPSRPRRSICFAATDFEEQGLLGAYALTCRSSADRIRIVASVNFENLGRTCFEKFPDTMIVMGTENVPSLWPAVEKAATDQGLRLLRVWTDASGARGDHVVFQGLEVPSIFFTCGLFRDYHQPTDTPDRIDYAALWREVEVARRTVVALAQAVPALEWTEPTEADRRELADVLSVLQLLCDLGPWAGLPADKQKALAELVADGRRREQAAKYTLQDRFVFLRQAADVLPTVIGVYQVLPLEAEGQRQFMRHFFEQWGGGTKAGPDFHFEGFAVRDVEIRVTRADDGTWELKAPIRTYAIEAKFAGPGQLERRSPATTTVWTLSGQGRQALLETCLQEWRADADFGKPMVQEVWNSILQTITETSTARDYDGWAKWVAAQKG